MNEVVDPFKDVTSGKGPRMVLGKYVVPICTSCGKLGDVRTTTCECGGKVPLVHDGGINNVTAVDAEAFRITTDSAYRERIRGRT